MFIEIFLLNTLKLLVDGSKLKIFILLCFWLAYNENNPILAPISQNIVFSSFLKLSIHLSVPGSLEKILFTLKSTALLGIKNLILLPNTFTSL